MQRLGIDGFTNSGDAVTNKLGCLVLTLSGRYLATFAPDEQYMQALTALLLLHSEPRTSAKSSMPTSLMSS